MNTKCTDCDQDAEYIRYGNSYCFLCNQEIRNRDKQQELKTTKEVSNLILAIVKNQKDG